MKMTFLVTAAFLLQSLAQAAHPTQDFNQWTGFPNTLKSDFFSFQLQQSSVNSKQTPITDCRAHIKDIVCLVEPMKQGDNVLTRTCLEGSSDYAIYFENIFDHTVPTLQKMFCSLSKLYIERQFYGSAYASTERGPNGEIKAVIMGVRQSILDQNLELQHWASWKEQLSFGGISNSYTVTANLPMIETPSTLPVNNFLYFAIVHEFGHLFDFANKVNQFKDCSDDKNSPECHAVPDSWSSLSWKNYDDPTAENDFAKRAGLCFYGCEDHPMTLADVPATYEGLAQSNFLSAYAATNPWDDFADSLGYFIFNQELKSSYVIDTNQGARYNIIAKLHSPLFAQKYNYLRSFLERTDLKYPGVNQKD